MHCRNRSRKVLPEVFDIFQPDIQPHDSVAVIRGILVSVKIVRGREARYARRVASLVFLPVLKLWVPRPRAFGEGGYDAADTMGLSCPAACIALAARIICTLSLLRVIGDRHFWVRHALATASFQYSNRRARGIVLSWSAMW